MSTTRSRCRAAPVIDAGGPGVLLVGHGSSTCRNAADGLTRHAARLLAAGGFSAVRIAALCGGPDPAEALNAMDRTRPVFVVPMFMSGGYLASRAVPRRLGSARDTRVRLCQPIGEAPELVALAQVLAEEARDDAGWTADDAGLVVAGHGSSKDGASRTAVEALAGGMREAGGFRTVGTGYLEEAPFIRDVAGALRTPAVVLGAFAADGPHAARDVPDALAAARVPVAYTGALGGDRRIPEIVRAVVAREQRAAAVAA